MYASAPGQYFFPVVPHDSTNFSQRARALYVGVSGNISVVGLDGTAVIFSNVPVGILPVNALRVNQTGTTASSIVALV